MKTSFMAILSGFVFLSTLIYPQWVEQTSGITSHIYAVNSVDASHAWAGADSKLLRTTDGGTTWSVIALTFTPKQIHFYDANNGIAGGGRVFKTTDGGLTWTRNNTLENIEAMFFLNSTHAWAAADGGYVYRTTDAGNTWTNQTTPCTYAVYSVYMLDENVGYVTHASGRLSKTTNGGVTWVQQPNVGSSHLQDMWFSNSNSGFIAVNGGLYKTTDGGGTWTFTAMTSYWNYYHFTCNNSNTIWMICTGGVLTSADNGANWIKENTPTFGYASWYWYDQCFCSQSVGWLVGSSGKIVKYTGATGTTEEVNISDAAFSLSQNFPNPFNSETKIIYSIPSEKESRELYARMEVYDINGIRVATLFEGFSKPGSFCVSFDGSKFTTGVYIYRLNVNGKLLDKKLILLK